MNKVKVDEEQAIAASQVYLYKLHINYKGEEKEGKLQSNDLTVKESGKYALN